MIHKPIKIAGGSIVLDGSVHALQDGLGFGGVVCIDVIKVVPIIWIVSVATQRLIQELLVFPNVQDLREQPMNSI